MQVEGLELPAYEPRASFSMALAYATADREACHQREFPVGSDALDGERDPHDTAGHASVVIDEQNENALTYSMVSCSFTAYNYERGGPADGNAITREEFETMFDSYYEQRGWTAEGTLTTETLERLEIESLASESSRCRKRTRFEELWGAPSVPQYSPVGNVDGISAIS